MRFDQEWLEIMDRNWSGEREY